MHIYQPRHALQLTALIILFSGLLFPHTAQAQAAFTGRVGTVPIELVLADYHSDNVEGVYVYTKYNSPIALSGRIKAGVLTLTENDSRARPKAELTFPAFAVTNLVSTGTWKNLATGQELPIELNRRFVAEASPNEGPNEYGLLQISSLPTAYFKLVIQAGDASTVSKVEILDKRTGRLLQKLPVAGEWRGFHSLSVGDYNFDGFPDFDVFEQSYAGPNTSSLYFLYNPGTKRYEQSSFSGVSLQFDARKKRIYETNSCCAGSSVTKAEYKVERNRMVLVAAHCYRWDEKRKELVERPLSACQ